MGIGSGFGDLFGGLWNVADPGSDGKRYLKQALGIWDDLPDPEFDPLDILMEQLLMTGELSPETYEVDANRDPSLISEDPALRESQLRSLGGMERIGAEGLPLQDRLMAEQAQRRVGSEFQRANDSIVADLARRGRAGGGTEVAARTAAAGNAAELARGMGSDLAMQSVGNRVMGLRESSDMAGGMRGQDRSTAAINAQMQNRVNEWLAQLDTQAARDAARSREASQLYNVGQRQRLSDANIQNRYTSRVGAQGRQDEIQRNLFDARARRATGQVGVLGGLATQQNARQAAKQQNQRSIAGGVGGILDAGLTYGGYGF